MKEIPLTQNKIAIVDNHWFDILNQYKWKALWNVDTKSFYAATETGGKYNRKTLYMHRIVAKTPKGMVCDHINHDTLDNRESQLRNLTPKQSNMNMRLRKDNELGIRGVRKTDSGCYTARLICEGKKVLQKNFKTVEEAVKARKDAEAKYFGEFAYQENLEARC
jgi:hypothetical protein